MARDWSKEEREARKALDRSAREIEEGTRATKPKYQRGKSPSNYQERR